MDKWIILNKFVILIYCFLKYISSSYNKNSLIILGLLFYIAISMIYYIVHKGKVKIIIGILSMILLVFFGSYFSSVFLFFIPINYIEFVYDNNLNNAYILGLIFVSPIFIHSSIRGEYFIILLFSYLIYILSYKSEYKVRRLLQENDNLKEKNDELYNKVNKCMTKSDILYQEV